MTSTGPEGGDCVLLYSGGTDSTCAAALMAEKFTGVHLLSFYQGKKKEVTGVGDTIRALQGRFKGVRFLHQVLPTTDLVKFISYSDYLGCLGRHGWLVLSTPGFTTLSWHVTAIAYCMKNGVHSVADGLTRELMHFPGHIDEVISVFKKLYADFGITYTNPVRDWEVPSDQQFIDRLIVDPHGYFFPSEETREKKNTTTGRYLCELGIMPHPNVKGSPMDHKMQYDCYPFVLYNIMAFWIYLNFQPYEFFCWRMRELFEEKAGQMRALLREYTVKGGNSRLSKLLGESWKSSA